MQAGQRGHERDADTVSRVPGNGKGQLKGDYRQETFGTGRLHHRQTEAGSGASQSRKGSRHCRQEKAEAEREKTVEAIDEAKSKIERLDEETRIKERISSELDGEIAEKRNKANTESGNAILSGIASLAGRGKYAEIAKENERLKTALTEAGRKHADKYNALVDKHNAQLSARQKAEKELADYRRGEADRIDKAVVKRTGEMQTQIEELEAKAKRKMNFSIILLPYSSGLTNCSEKR